MLDIDHFKRVNDIYGHEAGDQAIRRLAKILQQGIRGIDLAARIGGDEFAVLLTETDFSGGVEVAERLRVAIRTAEFPSAGRVTASFGVAECPLSSQTARELLTCADAAMYGAKHRGRDRVGCGCTVRPNSVAVGGVR